MGPRKNSTRARTTQIPLSEQAWGNVYRTGEFLRHTSASLYLHEEITLQQYNVLRVLRGAGADGLPTLEVGNRMVENTPGITRLLDKLEAKKLVMRTRSTTDRRVQTCTLTQAGFAMMARFDPIAEKRAKDSMASLSDAEMRTLITLLTRIRET